MGKFFDHLPGNLIPWVMEQKLFWVATAPLAEDGHVNVSPKGYEDTMHVMIETEDGKTVDSQSITEDSPVNFKKAKSIAVWYEDLTGSGAETIAHANENGRITILFSAFEGPPNIVRLFGTAKAYEFGTPEYEEILPLEKRQPSSRSVIWIDVHKVGTSCGFAIPFYTYRGPRNKHRMISVEKEQEDYDHYASCLAGLGDSEKPATVPELPREKGLKNYWRFTNPKSIDGVPAVQFAYESPKPLGDWRSRGVSYPIPDDESIPTKGHNIMVGRGLVADVGKILAGFGAGALVTSFLYKWAPAAFY
ncbi:hypothetical protein D9611_009202 [Ephemerocybe angulata]|uniref:Pyridoxamine 5'-phosphate oxidase putative domain-containing protein n=1 Tax=Ephemerocybe angulata TaxID=980116 RepID=A0A8H5CDH1_9AGAR|nr:hypothetical protein D9611_009202 [Tulosesus angulatus]